MRICGIGAALAHFPPAEFIAMHPRKRPCVGVLPASSIGAIISYPYHESHLVLCLAVSKSLIKGIASIVSKTITTAVVFATSNSRCLVRKMKQVPGAAPADVRKLLDSPAVTCSRPCEVSLISFRIGGWHYVEKWMMQTSELFTAKRILLDDDHKELGLGNRTLALVFICPTISHIFGSQS